MHPAEARHLEQPSENYSMLREEQPVEYIARLVREGDMIDLGDRVFEVMHLPGHFARRHRAV